MFSCADPESQWEYFVSKAMSILDCIAPLKRVKIRNPTAPPITEATKELIVERRASLRVGDRDRYKAINRQVKAAIRNDTRQDLQRRIQECGQGDLWRCIKPVVAGKQTHRPMPEADIDAMNGYFASVGSLTAR